jgi:hypothetical protein
MINIWVTHNGEIFDFGFKMILIHSKSNLTSQSSPPLLRILDLTNTSVSILPEVEEFLIVLYGFALQLFSS